MSEPPIEICSFGGTRTQSPFETSIGTRGYSTLRAALRDPANFGPGGIVGKPVTIRAGVAALTPDNLAGCGAFLTSVLSTELSGAEATALAAAVRGGMALIADGDTTPEAQAALNSILAVLGGGSVGGDANCLDSGTGGTFSGSYSEVSAGPFGDLRGKSFGTSPSANTSTLSRDVGVAACAANDVRYAIPRNALAPGSGVVMVGGDPSGYDLFTNQAESHHNPNNLRLYLNAIATAAGPFPDTMPPTITPPADIVTNTDPGNATAVVNYPAPTVADDRPGATSACAPTQGFAFPIGTTPVSCTATDAAGNTTSASFKVTVVDHSPPALTVQSSIVAVNGPTVNGVAPTGATVNYPAPTVADNAPDATSSCSPPSGYYFPFGATTVTCTATDTSGNTARASFTVTVCEAHFRSPLDEGRLNTVRSDRTIPVRISLACLGAPETGLQPSIRLLAGDVSPTSETGVTPVEATEPVWSADTDGIMREDNSGYYYKLAVPSSATPGQLLTIRVRPFGEANSFATMYIVIKIVK